MTTLARDFDLDAGRAGLLISAAVVLTGLLLHPGVPDIYRAMRQSLPLAPAQDFGYPAHVTAYLVLGAVATRLLRPVTARGRMLVIAAVCLHGVSTECSQLAVEGRTFDVLDMACNLTSATAGATLAARLHEDPAVSAA